MKFIDPRLDAQLPPDSDGNSNSTGASPLQSVTLANDADVESLREQLPSLGLVSLQFPKWTDGRAYSQARTLRARLGFKGEIRATGEVLVDMLPLLQRTGFDAVQLRPDQRPESAQRALRFFPAHYQGDVVEPRPAFQRDPRALTA